MHRFFDALSRLVVVRSSHNTPSSPESLHFIHLICSRLIWSHIRFLPCTANSLICWSMCVSFPACSNVCRMILLRCLMATSLEQRIYIYMLRVNGARVRVEGVWLMSKDDILYLHSSSSCWTFPIFTLNRVSLDMCDILLCANCLCSPRRVADSVMQSRESTARFIIARRNLHKLCIFVNQTACCLCWFY